MFNYISFNPPPGFSSPHIQTVMARFSKHGLPPPSRHWEITLEDGDKLYGKISTPLMWKEDQPTVVLVHGVGGDDTSGYMIRFSRKLYENGFRAVRMNLRGSGPGINLVSKPYNAGNSDDLKQVLTHLKNESPDSPLIVIGFSLGGNIVLKLAAEMETDQHLVEEFYAVCPPVDLGHTLELMTTGINKIYHRYYLHYLSAQAKKWLNGKPLKSLLEYDEQVTAPLWGYKDAFDYYKKCSSYQFIPEIGHSCNILYSGDDPIIDYRVLSGKNIPANVNIWVSSHGGHMGFIGYEGKNEWIHWMDNVLLKWLKGDFRKP